MMVDGKKIINDYIAWIKDNSFVRNVRNGEYCAITTPFMDRYNDHIDIYVSEEDGGKFRLSDDGDTIGDLTMSGAYSNTPKRKQIFEATVNGFGVETDGESLFTIASSQDLPQKKHALIQAILAVNDMYMMSQENVWSFFKEDVTAFLSVKNIPFVPNIKLPGKTGYDHTIDFVIPKTSKSPEKLIKTLNKADKNQVTAAVFAFADVAQLRNENVDGSEQIIVYNDEAEELNSDAQRALLQYNIKPLAWSKRDELVMALA
jgi:hypothetical protein